MTYQHPMRKAVFHAYERDDGLEFIVRAIPYGLCPMFFTGATRDEAMAKAEAFRADAVEKNEATYSARVERLAAARERKKA